MPVARLRGPSSGCSSGNGRPTSELLAAHETVRAAGTYFMKWPNKRFSPGTRTHAINYVPQAPLRLPIVGLSLMDNGREQGRTACGS